MCETLEIVSLYLAMNATLIIPPPREDVFPFRETNENKCGVVDSEAMRMKFFITRVVPHSFSVSRRDVYVSPFADTLKQYIDFSTPPLRGPPTLCKLYVLENV